MGEYVCELAEDYPGIEFGDEEYSGTCERRERVVRCRECARSSSDGERMTCDHPRCLGRMMAEPDGFCAWGERRGA